jgi:RecA-family ATPase
MTELRVFDFEDTDERNARKKITASRYVWRDPATIPPRSWLYGRHYIRQFVSATVAVGGLAKTSLILVEAIAMALKQALLGLAPTERTNVWIWNGEEPRDELDRRIAGICQHYQIEGRELGGSLFINSGRVDPIKMANVMRGTLTLDDALYDDLIATITANQIGCAIFDPFISTHSVPESDNTNIDLVVKRFGHIADETNASVELVHHVRKPATGQSEVTVEDARGATALVYAARSVRVLNRMSAKQAAELKIEEPRFYFRADTGKANLAPPEAATWHQLINVDLPNGDAVAVVTAWKYPALLERIKPDHMRRVRQMAAEGAYRKDARSDEWIGHAVAEAVGLNPENKADRAIINAALKAWFANGVLAIKRRKDEHRKERPYVVPGDWNAD